MERQIETGIKTQIYHNIDYPMTVALNTHLPIFRTYPIVQNANKIDIRGPYNEG